MPPLRPRRSHRPRRPCRSRRVLPVLFALLGALALPAACTASPDTHGASSDAGVAAQEVAGGEPGAAQSADTAGVARVLDAFHEAASRADGERYFGLFAEDGVFIGTDASERWPVEAFRAYAELRFRQGRGWTYVPVERWITLGPEGRTAWFHETLDSASFGVTRGTGVLVLEDGGWKVAQYHLTIPVPNDLAAEVVDMIRGG